MATCWSTSDTCQCNGYDHWGVPGSHGDEPQEMEEEEEEKKEEQSRGEEERGRRMKRRN